MRWIYLSPHFDDAVLSCGGLIWEQVRAGHNVEIWTIFAGFPPPGPLSEFASANHALWGVSSGEETVAMRRLEDQNAAAIVGAELVHFDLPDCIYRKSLRGDFLYTQTVMTTPIRADRGLPRRIATVLRSELEQDDRLLCPLALGGHVDHLQVRKAAESLREPLHYYADIPYVLNSPETLAPATEGWQSELHPISQAGAEAWLEGVRAYASQVGSLYKGPETLFEAIRSHWAREGGIRLWEQPVGGA